MHDNSKVVWKPIQLKQQQRINMTIHGQSNDKIIKYEM